MRNAAAPTVMRRAVVRPLAACACMALAASAGAQQTVKPPQAQAWIDAATFGGSLLPAGMANPMASLGGLFGGGAQKNAFGHTQTGTAGRWVDVTLYSRAQPALQQAEQAVPSGFLDSALRLQSPAEVRTAPVEPFDEGVVEDPTPPQRPQGKLLLYWGCGATVRPGQPKVLDMATASPADLAAFFQARRATQRGAHSAVGRPHWPSPADSRMVPANASLVGTHAFTAAGLPADFRFQIPAAQDLMPAPAVQQQITTEGATDLSWAVLPHARAYFIGGMGAAGQGEMVIWTSSELPETGFGLFDYQTNTAVDRWLREKVLLAPATTRCTVPKGVLSSGGMLRMIAYGSELNLAHPPRPQDPKVAWEPDWAVKVRVKSLASLMLGMPTADAEKPQAEPARREEPRKEDKPEDRLRRGIDTLRGILGR